MTKSKHPAFFHRDGDWLVAYGAARGPWSPDHCHAGPVAGVIAGAAEKAVPDKQLARVTASFYRPVPMAGIRIQSELVRDGRVASTVRITLHDRDDKIAASAECLLLQTIGGLELEATQLRGPAIEEAKPGRFGVEQVLHGDEYFGNNVEIAYPPGENGKPGPTTIWMRTPPIIEGEATSAFQRVCPLADCANGYARNSEFTTTSCVNPDLSITLHRLPESDWIAGKGRSIWRTDGIGMAEATLYDEQGAVGIAVQTLVLRSL